MDPAAELGDGISANGIYSGIYTMDLTFGPGFRGTVSAPFEEELEHEYHYVSKQERKINRKLGAFSSELKVQASKISAKVSRTGGSETEDSSFGWTLLDDSWTIQGNGRDVLKASPTGLEVYGKIEATSGSIGGFTIEDGYLSTNGHFWGKEEGNGVYLGPNGIQIGAAFQVTQWGEVFATDGHFSGIVDAGQITWGDDAGYFSGVGIDTATIYGNRLVGNTITTAYTSTGINGSLAYADFSNDVFNGYEEAWSIYSNTIHATYFYLDGKNVTRRSINVMGANGNTVTLQYLGWWN